MSFHTANCQDAADFYYSAVPVCANCGATSSNGAYLTDYPTSDNGTLPLCDGCCEAEAYTEKQADLLAALPSCDARQELIDEATTTRGLVNALTAHDMGCSCAARKPVATETAAVQQGVA